MSIITDPAGGIQDVGTLFPTNIHAGTTLGWLQNQPYRPPGMTEAQVNAAVAIPLGNNTNPGRPPVPPNNSVQVPGKRGEWYRVSDSNMGLGTDDQPYIIMSGGRRYFLENGSECVYDNPWFGDPTNFRVQLTDRTRVALVDIGVVPNGTVAPITDAREGLSGSIIASGVQFFSATAQVGANVTEAGSNVAKNTGKIATAVIVLALAGVAVWFLPRSTFGGGK